MERCKKHTQELMALVTSEACNDKGAQCVHSEEVHVENRFLLLISFASSLPRSPYSVPYYVLMRRGGGAGTPAPGHQGNLPSSLTTAL
jgi:hypothetical protein